MYHPLGFSQTRFNAIGRQLAAEMVAECFALISADGLTVPAHQRDWKIGQTFSWHYVKNVEFRTAQLFDRMEIMIMAARGKNAKKTSSMPSYEFVKCELSAEDKKAAKIWIEENTAQLGEMLHEVMADDYKFTVSFSQEHDTFTACLVGKPDQALNPQKTLTARHKDWTVAAMTVLYKHAVVFKSRLWENDATDDDDGWA